MKETYNGVIACKLQICVDVGNNRPTLSFIIKCDISCLGTVYNYRLHIIFNTTNSFRNNFYFVYLNTLPHSQLWGIIINI